MVEQKGVNWGAVGKGAGIAALGIGVGTGLYYFISGRAGAAAMQSAIDKEQAKIQEKRDKLYSGTITDPKVMAALEKDVYHEVDVLAQMYGYLSEKLGVPLSELLKYAVPFAAAGVTLYLVYRRYPTWRGQMVAVEQANPGTGLGAPDPQAAVYLGITPDMAPQVGLLPEQILAAEALLGVSASSFSIALPYATVQSALMAVNLMAAQTSAGAVSAAGAAVTSAGIATTLIDIGASIGIGVAAGVAMYFIPPLAPAILGGLAKYIWV